MTELKNEWQDEDQKVAEPSGLATDTESEQESVEELDFTLPAKIALGVGGVILVGASIPMMMGFGVSSIVAGSAVRTLGAAGISTAARVYGVAAVGGLGAAATVYKVGKDTEQDTKTDENEDLVGNDSTVKKMEDNESKDKEAKEEAKKMLGATGIFTAARTYGIAAVERLEAAAAAFEIGMDSRADENKDLVGNDSTVKENEDGESNNKEAKEEAKKMRDATGILTAARAYGIAAVGQFEAAIASFEKGMDTEDTKDNENKDLVDNDSTVKENEVDESKDEEAKEEAKKLQGTNVGEVIYLKEPVSTGDENKDLMDMDSTDKESENFESKDNKAKEKTMSQLMQRTSSLPLRRCSSF